MTDTLKFQDLTPWCPFTAFERDKENRKRSRKNRQGLTSQVRKDLNKVNPKAAEPLADLEEYPNLFEDWQVAPAVESKAAETLNVYPLAKQYISHVGK
ncbi:unnamed protein product [Lathyrus sativus]|nr:unnamed protein product [Lathyrus sativus]